MASPSITPVSERFVDTVNKFGFQLQALALDNDRSSGLCPMNIYHCLSMVAAGSKDANLKAFGQALNFDVPPSKTSALGERLDQVIQLDSYSKGNTAVDFSSASSVWHQADFILNAPWVSIIQNQFHATIGPLELPRMNAFIKSETRGKFTDLIKPTDLVGAVLYLVSCLYFKAKWANPFDSVSTEQNADFFTWNGKTETVKMMKKVDRMEYVEDKEKQVCILPYKTDDNPDGPKWKAAIILPKRKGLSAMKDLLTSFAASPDILHSLLTGSSPQAPPPHNQDSRGGLSSSAIPSLIGSLPRTRRPEPSSSRPTAQQGTPQSPRPLRSQKINLSLPRFSLKLNLDLIPHLKKLGLGPAFMTSDDFALISNGPLEINRVTHDLFLEVNEEGTEMAAVTIVGMSRSRPATLPPVMRVDRPFLFLVFDGVTGLVLCGVVVNSIVED